MNPHTLLRSMVCACAVVTACAGDSNEPLDLREQEIVNGVAATNAVTNVGTIVVKATADDDWEWWGCSGTLISPTAFLTAGHCLFGWQDVGFYAWGVTFTPTIELSADGFSGFVPSGAKVYAGTPIVHPDFSFDLFGDYHNDMLPDFAVIALNEPVKDILPARLPPVGYIANYQGTLSKVDMGMAGYGLTSFAPLNGNGVPDWGTRRYTNTKLTAVYVNMLQVNGIGDACVSDSGGPLFVTTPDVGKAPPPRFVLQVLGIVRGPTDESPGGDLLCSNGTTLTRLDTSLAHDFLEQFLR